MLSSDALLSSEANLGLLRTLTFCIIWIYQCIRRIIKPQWINQTNLCTYFMAHIARGLCVIHIGDVYWLHGHYGAPSHITWYIIKPRHWAELQSDFCLFCPRWRISYELLPRIFKKECMRLIDNVIKVLIGKYQTVFSVFRLSLLNIPHDYIAYIFLHFKVLLLHTFQWSNPEGYGELYIAWIH